MKIFIVTKIDESLEFLSQVDEVMDIIELQGHEAVTPFVRDMLLEETFEQHLAKSIKMLCECDRIWLMDGWYDSAQASTLVMISIMLVIPIHGMTAKKRISIDSYKAIKNSVKRIKN